MALDITWTRRALKLPPRVRSDLERRLTRVARYFPEMKPQMKIGLTKSYDGMVFESEDGQVKLMLGVSRKRAGGWLLPTHWTIAHELMHLVQFNSKGIPGGERATDIYALARLPQELIDASPRYLVVPKGLRTSWTRRDADLARRLAKKAIRLRDRGLRRYAVWWEKEFEKAVRERRKTR